MEQRMYFFLGVLVFGSKHHGGRVSFFSLPLDSVRHGTTHLILTNFTFRLLFNLRLSSSKQTTVLYPLYVETFSNNAKVP
uniref:Uncharacterized protein n=1 Tax=Cucumis melo TaxID=3656 RepID=A0A9I9EB83_CUCME